MKYKTLIFDLDGTLTDPKTGITSCVQYALRKAGIPADDLSELLPYIGPPLRRSFRSLHGLSDEQAQQAVLDYRERFSRIGMYENEVYPGIPEMLGALRDTGYGIVLATSKLEQSARDILKHFKLDGFFDFIAGSLPDGNRSEKGDVIRHALQANRLLSDITLMVGDTKYDIEGAWENDLDSVAVSYGYGDWDETLASRPTYTCGTVTELRDLLLGFAHQDFQIGT